MHKLITQLRKIAYYTHGAISYIAPRFWYRRQLPHLLDIVENDPVLQDRLHYYIKQAAPFTLSDATSIQSLRPNGRYTYFFDLYRILRHFPSRARVAYLFGDITHIPDEPSFVKSRPIDGDNRASVLLKLNQIRHFTFVSDSMGFEDKKNSAIWRGKCAGKLTRIQFMDQFFHSPLCDLGDPDKRIIDSEYYKPFTSIKEQLQHKFIISIEGNDVASNLKWIMSSNSLCMMPKPKYETWFMEGVLTPNHHYALLKDDLSDLEDRIRFYQDHPEQALSIIANAHQHVKQFKHKQNEHALSVAVVNTYIKEVTA